MRNQVIDVVGQISTQLPLWMTSKQPNGRVLGFTPAWVIAYVNPGRAKEVAYFIQTYFAQQLNSVDFKVDRYILDRVLSKNWDTDGQHWTPRPPTLTTFDRFSTGGKVFIGTVNICTSLAWSDVNNRTLDYINDLGGLDGVINQDSLGLQKIYLQAKRYQQGSNIGGPEIQAFMGALHGQGANGGVFITTSKFTKAAEDYVAKNMTTRIILIDGLELGRLLVKYEVGVVALRSYKVLEIDENLFDETEK